jgi:uncharacterized phage protein (TIGR02218 family)
LKTIPTALAVHLQGEVTRLASLFTITRKDGAVFRFTDHDRDLVHAGQAYRSRAGYERTAVAGTSGLETDSVEVTAVFDDEGITEHDLLAGAFDHAEVTLALVRWDEPAQGLIKLRRGRLGETTTRDGSFAAELHGLVDALKQEFGQIYGPTCRADLGDNRCGIDLGLHVQTAAITTVLGPDSFTVTPALATANPIPGGKVVFTTGANAGIQIESRGYDGGSQTLELFVPPPFALAVGDAFQVHPSCNKLFPTCKTVWNNGVNFRGEPHLPGRDFLLTGAEGGG